MSVETRTIRSGDSVGTAAQSGDGRRASGLVEVQRDVLRRLAAADAERQASEQAAVTELARVRERVTSEIRVVETRTREAVKEAKTAVPEARQALERVQMLGLLNSRVGFERTSGYPEEELAMAVAGVNEAVGRVKSRVKAYEEHIANRTMLRTAALAVTGAVLVVLVVKLAGAVSVRPDSSTSVLQREFQRGAAPAVPAAAPVQVSTTSSASEPVSPRITLQYQVERDADRVAGVRNALQQHSDWRVGSPERVLPAGDNRAEVYGGVRFFFEEDSVLARSVCEAIRNELAQHGYDVTFPIWPMITLQRQGHFKARRGLIEVWISPLPEQKPGADPARLGKCGR